MMMSGLVWAVLSYGDKNILQVPSRHIFNWFMLSLEMKPSCPAPGRRDTRQKRLGKLGSLQFTFIIDFFLDRLISFVNRIGVEVLLNLFLNSTQESH